MKELEQFINQANRWAEMTNSRLMDVASPSIEDCETLFSSVACKLSPENLHCDGEISNAEAKRKYVYLNKVWDQLESIYGRRVGEHEAFNWG